MQETTGQKGQGFPHDFYSEVDIEQLENRYGAIRPVKRERRQEIYEKQILHTSLAVPEDTTMEEARPSLNMAITIPADITFDQDAHCTGYLTTHPMHYTHEVVCTRQQVGIGLYNPGPR